jgi:hypothetical protein
MRRHAQNECRARIRIFLEMEGAAEKSNFAAINPDLIRFMAGTTGLEPATSAVTGRKKTVTY